MNRIFRRVLLVLPTLWLTMTIVFLLMLLVPGDPAIIIAGENPSPGQVEAIRESMGLNDPLLIRYMKMLAGVFTGDLGSSLFSSQTVWGALSSRLSVTISLTTMAVFISLIVGVPLGIVSGIRPGSIVDRIATLLASVGMALPSFWLGLILITFLAIGLGWFPAIGYAPMGDGLGSWLMHLILPALALAVNPIAETTRQLRASMREVLLQDYIRTARSQGLPSLLIVVKHALRNALIPVLSVIGVQITNLIGGVVVIEAVFGLPGVGSLAVDAVTTMDLPVVQGVVVFGVIVAIGINLIVDLLYSLVNPKVRAA